MTADNTDQPIIWAIRFTTWASADLAAAWRHFALTAGEDIANAWNTDLKAEIAKLARLPERHSVANETRFFSYTVRKFLYRRTPRGPAYHVFFALRVSPDDAPSVQIMHIRHAARSPITRKEAREIESSE